jgi:hypothetical protein
VIAGASSRTAGLTLMFMAEFFIAGLY